MTIKEHQQPLEPCPFCGGPAAAQQYRSRNWGAGCVSGDCQHIMTAEAYGTSRARAIAAWNTRALTPPGTGWRPISEAPKDRGAILGFMRIGDGNVTRVLHWDDEDAEWHSEGNHYDPTHFMPLPAPPTGDEE